jgi:hypothetical protein
MPRCKKFQAQVAWKLDIRERHFSTKKRLNMNRGSSLQEMVKMWDIE